MIFDFFQLVRQTGAVKITTLSAATFLHVAAWYSAHQIIDHILKGHSESLIEKKTVVCYFFIQKGL